MSQQQTKFMVGDRVTRAANQLLHIDEFTGVITGFWRVENERMAHVCSGQNCILTGENNLRIAEVGNVTTAN